MTIVDRPPKGWKRQTMPVAVKLQAIINRWEREVALAAQDDSACCPFADAGDIHFDHRPALWERKFDTEANDTIPPANDPASIEALTLAEHKLRTHGTPTTTAGSDSHRRAKDTRAKKEHQEFVARVLDKACGAKRQPTGNWKPGRKLQSRNDLRRKP